MGGEVKWLEWLGTFGERAADLQAPRANSPSSRFARKLTTGRSKTVRALLTRNSASRETPFGL